MTQAPPPHNYDAPPPKKGLGAGAIIGIVLGGVLLLCVPLILCMIGILMPALGKARQSARQIMSSTQMRQVVMALQMYANENLGMYPEAGADLATRLAPYGITPAVLTSPNAPPVGPSYYYVPLGDSSKITSPHSMIILYENPAIPSRQWNLARADGWVELIPGDQYRQLVDGIKLPDGTPWTPHLGD